MVGGGAVIAIAEGEALLEGTIRTVVSGGPQTLAWLPKGEGILMKEFLTAFNMGQGKAVLQLWIGKGSPIYSHSCR